MTKGPTAAAGEPWTVQDVLNWLASLGMSEHAPAFKNKGIDGIELLKLDENCLLDLGVDVRMQGICLFVTESSRLVFRMLLIASSFWGRLRGSRV